VDALDRLIWVLNADDTPEVGPGNVVVGVWYRRDGPRPEAHPRFDILLSDDLDASKPWVGLSAEALDVAIAELSGVSMRCGIAAGVAAQVLRTSESLDFEAALVVESLAYSALLGGREFKEWRTERPVRKPPSEGSRVRLERLDDGILGIALGRAQARNAFDARMRDELVEALEFALIDPDQAPVELTGDGPAFSAGGDLDEFGTATDLALAHAIRVAQSPARLVHRLGARLTARVHGACVGAGIEVPAAAARVVATPDAWFRLPEVAMGLIPGAGGTASIPRRIGRHRACYMALTGRDIDAATALAWGLVDAVEPAP
jgi:enoyl-CoA hydratase/carnithine racemase